MPRLLSSSVSWHVLISASFSYGCQVLPGNRNSRTRYQKPTSDIVSNLEKIWWRHEMKTFFALLTICAGNLPVTGEFPAQRPVTRSFDVFFDLRLNKRLSKQSWGWWFETTSRPSWLHINDNGRNACAYVISLGFVNRRQPLSWGVNIVAIKTLHLLWGALLQYDSHGNRIASTSVLVIQTAHVFVVKHILLVS